MTVEHFALDASAVIRQNAFWELLVDGFTFTEGALWHARDHYLLFSDIDVGRIHRWDAQHGVTVFRDVSNMANGNTWDNHGRLLSCEHATSRVVRTEHDSSIAVLASHYEWRELNSPSDIIVARDGAIYFSDPVFGRRAPHGIPRAPELDHRSCYRLGTDGHLIRLAVDLEQPNGLCFSADEKMLYVNDSPRARMHVHHVKPDGTVEAGALFADVPGHEDGVPDGMKVDTKGNVYCCGAGGIQVFAPSGQRLARIRFPERANNLAFGDSDMRTLYVTSPRSIYRIRLEVAGIAQWRTDLNL
ncbi:SMP-30/gluconolactonase/LRE family protein [Variovorax sp. RT4R15]|uniref:SMP-30/gluconolactonase/LRE family protein n=1 Tax=Variovorax sp. RT4R15 TaxID=3443737 RepID=UPI003F4665A1